VPKPLLLIAGPSGVGKTTLVENLCRHFDNVEPVVSITTREKRPGEVEAREYHFVTLEEFERRRDAGLLLEWARFRNIYHGMMRTSVSDIQWRNHYPVRAIDPSGIDNIESAGVKCRVVFLDAISDDELMRRLLRRSGKRHEAPDWDDLHGRLRNAGEVERPWCTKRLEEERLKPPNERNFWFILSLDHLTTLRRAAWCFGLPTEDLPSHNFKQFRLLERAPYYSRRRGGPFPPRPDSPNI